MFSTPACRGAGSPASFVSMVLFALLLAATVVAAEDWNTAVGGKASRDGQSQYVGPTEPDLLWQGSLSAIVSQQAAIDANIVVMSRISSFTIPTGTWIVAHDLTTGDILWQTQLPYDFPEESWRSKTSAIRDGQVYASRAGNTNADYLYALDQDTGDIVWQSEDLIDESTTESLAFTANGDLIVGNFSSLMRINKDTGLTMWTIPRTCPTSDGCSAAVYGEHVYIWQASATGPKVSVFDIASGVHLYSSDGIGGGFIQQLGLLVGPDGTVYAPRTQNNPITDFFVAFEDTGAGLVEKWRRPLGYVPFASFGVGPDGSVYMYTRLKEVQRLDPEDGTVLNTSDPIAGDFFSPRMAIDAEGKVFVTNGSFTGSRFYSFNADLSVRWDTAIPNVNLGGPAIGPGGILIVCGTGTDVRAYQTVSCPEDVNGDDVVDIVDLLAVLEAWGSVGDVPEDVNGDEVVDILDLLAVLAAWGPC